MQKDKDLREMAQKSLVFGMNYFLVMSFPQHWSGTVQVPPPPVEQVQTFET